jgi:hypothetical protein
LKEAGMKAKQDQMTNFEYEQEISEMLNTKPAARNAFESVVEYQIMKHQNDWAGMYRFVYEWMHGSAKNKTDLRRKIKSRRQFGIDL